MTSQVSSPMDTSIPENPRGANRQAYLQALLAHSSELAADASPWLKTVRDRAQALIQEQALPTTRDEDWRFTDLSSLYRIPFQPAPSAQIDPADLSSLTDTATLLRFVFVNGRFAPQLSTQATLPTGLTFTSLPNLETSLQTQLGQQQGAGEVFTALNSCNFTDVAAISVEKNQQVESPIHLVFVVTADEGAPVVTYPRVLVNVGTGSEVTLLEEFVSIGASSTFTNAVTEITVAANARLHHIRLQREGAAAFHIGKTAVTQARDSYYRSLAINLGSQISRHNPEIVLTGEQAETKLDGLTLAVGEQVVDTHSNIAFTHPYCSAQQLHKCIVDDRARAVFNGKVFVPKAAQRTDASQMSRNLLLSPKARVDTKPQLEIVADDVKCAHGATVSQLDDDEVFYLQSRGLDRTAACDLLVEAFAAEIINQVPLDSIRQQLTEAVLSQVR